MCTCNYLYCIVLFFDVESADCMANWNLARVIETIESRSAVSVTPNVGPLYLIDIAHASPDRTDHRAHDGDQLRRDGRSISSGCWLSAGVYAATQCMCAVRQSVS